MAQLSAYMERARKAVEFIESNPEIMKKKTQKQVAAEFGTTRQHIHKYRQTYQGQKSVNRIVVPTGTRKKPAKTSRPGRIVRMKNNKLGSIPMIVIKGMKQRNMRLTYREVIDAARTVHPGIPEKSVSACLSELYTSGHVNRDGEAGSTVYWLSDLGLNATIDDAVIAEYTPRVFVERDKKNGSTFVHNEGVDPIRESLAPNSKIGKTHLSPIFMITLDGIKQLGGSGTCEQVTKKVMEIHPSTLNSRRSIGSALSQLKNNGYLEYSRKSHEVGVYTITQKGEMAEISSEIMDSYSPYARYTPSQEPSSNGNGSHISNGMIIPTEIEQSAPQIPGVIPASPPFTVPSFTPQPFMTSPVVNVTNHVTPDRRMLVRGPGGRWNIENIMGTDEEDPNVTYVFSQIPGNDPITGKPNTRKFAYKGAENKRVKAILDSLTIEISQEDVDVHAANADREAAVQLLDEVQKERDEAIIKATKLQKDLSVEQDAHLRSKDLLKDYRAGQQAVEALLKAEKFDHEQTKKELAQSQKELAALQDKWNQFQSLFGSSIK